MNEAIDPAIEPLAVPSRSVRTDVLAYVAGQVSSAAVSLLVVPVYLAYLGRDAFGLWTFFATLQGMVRFIDLGLTNTVIRETARFNAAAEWPQLRSLVRTFEWLFGTIALLTATTVVLTSPWIASHWLHAKSLGGPAVARTLMIMGTLCGFSWMTTFYQSVLIGLERHVAVNVMRVSETALTATVALILLSCFSPTVEVLLAGQLAVLMFSGTLAFVVVWIALPPDPTPPTFCRNMMAVVWRSVLGMAGVSATGMVLAQVDRVSVSAMVELRGLGDYNLACMVAGIISTGLSMPLYMVMLPRFSALASKNDWRTLGVVYHTSIQFVSSIGFATAATLFLYGRSLIEIWTRNPGVADAVAPLAAYMTLAFAVNALMATPSALLIACGLFTLNTRINLMLTVIYLPIVLLLSYWIGPIGATYALLIMNLAYLSICFPMLHAHVLKGEAPRVYLGDVLPQTTICGAIALGLAALGPLRGPALMQLLQVGLALASIAFAALMTGAHTRPVVLSFLRAST